MNSSSKKVAAASRERARQQRENMREPERQRQADEAAQAVEQNLRDAADKVRENRLRRMAERQGLRLVKSRRRDPHAFDHGRYMLHTIGTNDVVFGAPITGPNGSATLDEVEEFLSNSRDVFERVATDLAIAGSDAIPVRRNDEPDND
jgi:hypothetical protein